MASQSGMRSDFSLWVMLDGARHARPVRPEPASRQIFVTNNRGSEAVSIHNELYMELFLCSFFLRIEWYSRKKLEKFSFRDNRKNENIIAEKHIESKKHRNFSYIYDVKKSNHFMVSIRKFCLDFCGIVRIWLYIMIFG